MKYKSINIRKDRKLVEIVAKGGSAPTSADSVVLGVILYKFPAKSNTFIVNELIELHRRGVEVYIYSISAASSEDLEVFKSEINEIGDRIINISDVGMFSWRDVTRNSIPLSTNTFRKGLNSLSKEEIELAEIECLDNSLPAVEGIILDMKSKGINRLYAPFANLEAELCLMISHHTKIPFAISCHSYDLFCQNGYKQIKFQKASKVFCVSQYNIDYITTEYNCPEKLVLRRVNYIQESDPNMDSMFDFEYILGVGRLVAMKGFKYTILAFNEFRKKHHDVHYVIAGSGPKLVELVELVESLGLSDCVHFMGYITNSQILSLIKGATFSILSSIVSLDGDLEGIPTFFLESMSIGVPCIGSNYSGIPELIEHGETGVLTEIGDVDGISKAMDELYTMMNSYDCDSISLKCVAKVNELFDNKLNIEILIKGIDEMRINP